MFFSTYTFCIDTLGASITLPNIQNTTIVLCKVGTYFAQLIHFHEVRNYICPHNRVNVWS